MNWRNFSVKEMCPNLQLQPSICWFIKMIRYISTCFLAVNTSFASTHFTTECDLSQGAGPSSANHMVFQLHSSPLLYWNCWWAFLIDKSVFCCDLSLWTNISAVCPLSSPILCFIYCHGWLCRICPVAWLNRYDSVREDYSGRKTD